jgi:hypothetical protein
MKSLNLKFRRILKYNNKMNLFFRKSALLNLAFKLSKTITRDHAYYNLLISKEEENKFLANIQINNTKYWFYN